MPFWKRKDEKKKGDAKGKGKEPMSSPRVSPKTPRTPRTPVTKSPSPRPSPRPTTPTQEEPPPTPTVNTGKDVPFFQYSPVENASAVRFIDHSCHCFAAFFMSFKFNSVSPFLFGYSIFDQKMGITLSEEIILPISIVEQVRYKNEEEKLIDSEKRGMLFKDLTKEEMSKGEYWLICRVVKLMTMKFGDEEKEGVRVPVGWGAIPLHEAIGDQAGGLEEISAFTYVDEGGGAMSERKSRKRMEESIPPRTFQVYQKPTDMTCQDMLMKVTSKSVQGLVDLDMSVSVACRMDPIPNEHSHLGLAKKVGKNVQIADRLSLFIHTTSSQAFDRTRDGLYVTVTDGFFPDCPKDTFVTITMSVKQFSGKELNCLSLGKGEPTSEVTFVIDKNGTNSPQIGELCIVSLHDLPAQALHLFFTITMSPPPDYLEPGQQMNAFLKMTSEGKFLDDGNYKLKCFWRAPGTNRMNNVYYIKNAATTTFSTGKDFLNLRTSLGSSSHTQHKDLNAVLHWQEYPPNMFKSLVTKSLLKGAVGEADIFRVFSKLITDLLAVYRSEKHASIQPDIFEALYTLVKLCLKPRSDCDVLFIAGSNDLACVLGYFLLAMDQKADLDKAQSIHMIFVGLFNRVCEEIDKQTFVKVAKIDWPTYDQYLGVLLSGWSTKAVMDSIMRNKKRRETRKEKKTVRFTLPDKDECWGGKKAGGSSLLNGKEWSVDVWLEQIGMSKYVSNFKNEGYCTLLDIQGLSLASLEKMSVNVPRHRKKLLEESAKLC